MKAFRELHRAGLAHPNERTRTLARRAVVQYTQEIRRVKAAVAEQERRFHWRMQVQHALLRAS